MKNWIETYQLENGDFDISDVNKELVSQIPSAIQMGKVYQRLIVDTTLWNENYVDEIYRVYNSDICDIIDNYNCSAYYEPSYIVPEHIKRVGFKGINKAFYLTI